MSTTTEISLDQPYALGPLELPNRAVMAPMTRSRAPGSVPNALMAEYYAQRAGAGLQITEGTAPSPNGLGYPRIPGVYSEQQVEGWRVVTDAVHQAGGRIFLQLMHTGRATHPANLPPGARAVTPSAVEMTETRIWVDAEGAALPVPVAHAMTDDDVRCAIHEYARAARNAIDAGFDGVELHGANGYLIEQFLHPHTNRRSDAWGGSIEARNRFAVEVARAAADAIGPERLGIRVSPYGTFNEMPRHDGIDEAYEALAEALDGLGLLYLHLIDPPRADGPTVPPRLRTRLREAFTGTLILAGGYDEARATADLESGAADLIAFGRPYLANPDLLERFRRGAELNEPRKRLFYAGGAEGYTDYPTLDD